MRHEAIAIELDLVVLLWVDLDPGEEPEASVVAGKLRGLDLPPALLEAIADAYELEILQEATTAIELREHPALPLGGVR